MTSLIHARDSRRRAAALALSATLLLLPANLLPVISIDVPGQYRRDTIFTGIVGLYEHGLWPLALIVFAASFMVPFLKLAGLAWLLIATRDPKAARRPSLARLYRILDFIGRWSMLDVFLVTFLCGAVQFGLFGSIQPRAGIVAFAAVVVLTMLATAAFDPRSLDVNEASAEGPP